MEGLKLKGLIQKYGLVILKIILKKRNKARYTQILEDFPATSGTLSRALKALEQEGFIKRLVDSDARPPVSYYSITEKGYKLVRDDLSDSYMALMEFDPNEAEKLLEKLRKRLEELKKS